MSVKDPNKIDGMGIDELRLLANEGDVGVGENALDTCTELRNYLHHTLTGFFEGGAMNVGLGGNATYIKTGASHVVALEDDNLQALLGSIFSGAVPTRARTDDDKISCCHLPFVYKW